MKFASWICAALLAGSTAAASAAPPNPLPPLPPTPTQQELKAYYASLGAAQKQYVRQTWVSLTEQQRQYLKRQYRDLPVSDGGLSNPT